MALDVGFSMLHWLVYGTTVGKSKDFVPDDAPGACTNMRRASLELPRALLWSLRCFVLLICFGTGLIGRKIDLTISETKKQKKLSKRPGNRRPLGPLILTKALVIFFHGPIEPI